MTTLSPAAQQVFWEFNRAASGKPDDWHYLPAIAAALRAAADQVVPEECLTRFPIESEWQDGFTDANERIRADLLAIADELDGIG
jgi:hypothetical protein